MGVCSSYRRGKRGQKHYTVFLADVDEAVKAAYVPRLNKEHSSWRWFNVADLRSLIGSGCSHSGDQAPASLMNFDGLNDVVVHPVVLALLRSETNL